MLQHSRRRDSLKPGAAGSADLYLRLVRRSSEMYQRPEAIRVVVEPATQSGRADRRSVGYGQTERREEVGGRHAKQGIDMLIRHPRLVQASLDLTDFQTLCWYETEFSVFQSTEKGRVLVGSRSGSSWDGMVTSRQQRGFDWNARNADFSKW